MSRLPTHEERALRELAAQTKDSFKSYRVSPRVSPFMPGGGGPRTGKIDKSRITLPKVGLLKEDKP